jgi:hypothetical protein
LNARNKHSKKKDTRSRAALKRAKNLKAGIDTSSYENVSTFSMNCKTLRFGNHHKMFRKLVGKISVCGVSLKLREYISDSS